MKSSIRMIRGWQRQLDTPMCLPSREGKRKKLAGVGPDRRMDAGLIVGRVVEKGRGRRKELFFNSVMNSRSRIRHISGGENTEALIMGQSGRDRTRTENARGGYRGGHQTHPMAKGGPAPWRLRRKTMKVSERVSNPKKKRDPSGKELGVASRSAGEEAKRAQGFIARHLGSESHGVLERKEGTRGETSTLTLWPSTMPVGKEGVVTESSPEGGRGLETETLGS